MDYGFILPTSKLRPLLRLYNATRIWFKGLVCTFFFVRFIICRCDQNMENVVIGASVVASKSTHDRDPANLIDQNANGAWESK